MLSNLKKLIPFKVSEKVDLSAQIEKIQSELNNGLLITLEKVFQEQMADSNNSNYKPEDVDKIIQKYTHQNMLIATATSLVPGPLGILSSVPQLLLNFNNQMRMIYDLGCATGKESFINKDILLDIPMAAFGGNTNLAALQNSANLEDSPQDLLFEKASTLGTSMVQRILKKSIVQFIPVAGPVLMATWSKMASRNIAKVSVDFLDDNLIYKEHLTPAEDESKARLLQIEKIKALSNLIESNNDFNEDQIALIGTIIANATLEEAEKEYYLEESLKPGSTFPINRDLIKDYEEENDLIMEVIIMAKRSGRVDDLERSYIYELGDYLSVDKSLIDDLLREQV